VNKLNFNKIWSPDNQEPPVPAAAGFLALPSVDMRLAPEVLILELFRDIFYSEKDKTEKNNKIKSSVDLNPDLTSIINEKAVISALRGRRKINKNKHEVCSYAPAYPSLARYAWLRDKRGKVVSQLLFRGALSQHLWGKTKDTILHENIKKSLINLIINALVGNNKKDPNSGKELPDILNACLSDIDSKLNIDAARNVLSELISITSERVFNIPDGNDDDPLAKRIYEDFRTILDIEKAMPRLLWIKILMTFLRFSLPMWLLAEMQLTVITHGWFLNAFNERVTPTDQQILDAFSARNKDILRPTITPTKQLDICIAEYIKCRVELTLMLNMISDLNSPTDFNLKKVITTQTTGQYSIKLSELLALAKKSVPLLHREDLYVKAGSFNSLISREAEKYPAWCDPLEKGQGKNIREFCHVLRKSYIGDEAGGHLLLQEGARSSIWFKVFPGKMLLKTITLLADKSNEGRLVLKDIEDHFSQYGISFSTTEGARKPLINELEVLGLLSGSPDAGSSVEVRSAF